MIIFKDLLTGDELFSDTYKMKTVDDVLYEVDGKMITETTKVSDSMFGGNASAEGGEEDGGAEAASTSGCNIVIANRLVETSLDKKQFQAYIKLYIKKLVDRLQEKSPERVAAFKESAKKTVVAILKNFKDYQFFTGEVGQGFVANEQDTLEAESMIVLMNFREDGMTPYMLFWKDGLVEEKV